MATGEAAFDRRGLAIDDRQQGWRFRIGEISPELLATAASASDPVYDGYNRYDSAERRFYEDLAQAGPVFGLWWGVRF